MQINQYLFSSSVIGHSVRILRLGCLVILLVMMPVFGAEEQPAFRIQAASFSLDETQLVLNSEIEIELPSYIKVAIEKGFAVPLMFEVEILSPKKYWLDNKIVSLKQQYQLHFLPMLSSYVIFDLNAGQRYYFDNLSEAVQYIQVVFNYPMLDINNVNDERGYYARMRFGIDSDVLPVPLKSSSLWDRDWDLRSDWFVWDVKQSSHE